MAKRKTKPDTRGPLQRVIDREAVANDQSNISVITPEMRAKGTYQGERRIVNNHDPVARWIATNRLEPHQIAVIERCRTLWERSGVKQHVTASYGQRIPSTGSAELRTAREIEARKDLRRIMGYFAGLMRWWDVFENVCRFGMNAGVAGSELGFGTRGGADRAHTVVCFVADKIAEQERM